MVMRLFIARWRSRAATFLPMIRGPRQRATALIPPRCVGIMLALLALGGVAQATTITVNSLADPGTSGICALRDAITAANTKAAVNGCTAGSGNDTIVFSLTGTITLDSTLPTILNTLTIQGPSASPPAISIDGADTYQVMDVNSGATLNLSYLTIENGFAGADTSFLGGGIYNQGALSVTNSIFSGDIAGLGGGISNNGGTVTITNSTFSGNNALQGAGIANFDSTVSVTDSTFSGNSGGLGGGIMNFNGTLNVANSTFSGNTTGSGGVGGGIASSGTLTVTDCTFSGNDAGEGGGIVNFNGGADAADIRGTILTDNSGGNCFLSFPVTESFNLDDDGSCGFSSGTTSDADIALDPAGLQNNGGPTETVALEPGSVAINQIPVADCTYQNVNPCTNPPTASASGPLVCDQRGEPRPGNGDSACAIGAFEPQLLAEFAEFDTGLIVFPNQFAAGGSFTLAADAPTFNPATQAVTMTLSSASFGPLSVTIPAGSFKLNAKGQYKYTGTLAGVNYGVSFLAPVDGVYEFTFAVFGVDVTGITNPVSVTLQIGGNIGTDDNVSAAIL